MNAKAPSAPEVGAISSTVSWSEVKGNERTRWQPEIEGLRQRTGCCGGDIDIEGCKSLKCQIGIIYEGARHGRPVVEAGVHGPRDLARQSRRWSQHQ